MLIKSVNNIITKFPYNARSDWLKQRALSENRARLMTVSWLLQIFASEF